VLADQSGICTAKVLPQARSALTEAKGTQWKGWPTHRRCKRAAVRHQLDEASCPPLSDQRFEETGISRVGWNRRHWCDRMLRFNPSRKLARRDPVVTMADVSINRTDVGYSPEVSCSTSIAASGLATYHLSSVSGFIDLA
jgi:hypothetical protein